PFIVGFHHIITSQLPAIVAKKLKKNTQLLAFLVLIVALVSFYLPGIAIAAIILAIVGKRYINYLLEQDEQNKEAMFLELNNELKIFAIVPNSPAYKLGLRVGDLVTKVNDSEVTTVSQLNDEMDNLIRYPNFEVIGSDHQVRKIVNNQYKGHLSDLGIIFLKRQSK